MAKSHTITIYKWWTETATQAEIDFVDAVYALCEKNYDAGGDMVVECQNPKEILANYTTLEDVKENCLLLVEEMQNQRWGDDSELDKPAWEDK